MQKYGVDKFAFEILAEVEENKLKEAEQQFIETLKPTYKNRRANGFDIERNKKYMKEYKKSDKYKKAQKKYQKKYKKSDKGKKAQKKYDNQLCFYNGETLTLNALRKRFKRQGLSNPSAEAKKYLI